MFDLNSKELLNLYFYISDQENLNSVMNTLLLKVEKAIFNSYSVSDIERLREVFKEKGVV